MLPTDRPARANAEQSGLHRAARRVRRTNGADWTRPPPGVSRATISAFALAGLVLGCRMQNGRARRARGIEKCSSARGSGPPGETRGATSGRWAADETTRGASGSPAAGSNREASTSASRRGPVGRLGTCTVNLGGARGTRTPKSWVATLGVDGRPDRSLALRSLRHEPPAARRRARDGRHVGEAG